MRAIDILDNPRGTVVVEESLYTYNLMDPRRSTDDVIRSASGVRQEITDVIKNVPELNNKLQAIENIVPESQL